MGPSTGQSEVALICVGKRTGHGTSPLVLTIADRQYNGDYGMPQWGDYAIVKVKEGADVPDLVTARLFDEDWRLTPPGR